MLPLLPKEPYSVLTELYLYWQVLWVLKKHYEEFHGTKASEGGENADDATILNISQKLTEARSLYDKRRKEEDKKKRQEQRKRDELKRYRKTHGAW